MIQQKNIQVWLVDQHLNQDKIGLDFILEHRSSDIPVALITADSDPELPQRLKALNIVLLKTVKACFTPFLVIISFSSQCPF